MLLKNYRYILYLILSISFIFAIYSDINPYFKKINTRKILDNKFNNSSYIEKLITLLQEERGLSVIYHTDKKDNFQKLLMKQYLKIDMLLQDKKNSSSFKEKLNYIREKNVNIFAIYTNLIKQLLDKNENLIVNTDNSYIKDNLIIYQKLNLIQEYYGELRAKIGSILEKRYNHKSDLVAIGKLKILIEFNTNYIKLLDSIKHLKIINHINNKSYNLKINVLIDKIIDNKKIQLTSLQWYDLSTSNIKNINSIAKEFFKKTVEKNKNLYKSDINNIIIHSIFWITIVFLTLYLLYTIYKTDQKLEENNILLQQYKDTIDSSTIVSKTNASGVITYANDAFCKISGYSIDELIGKSHNILRQQKTPKSLFKNLWSTIKRGERWYGEFENRNKNGSSYWVQATISPIYNKNGELVEYIAIRNDITNLYLLNEQIRKTQAELIYRVGEAVESRSKETGNHVRRVANYSSLLGELYGLDKKECEELAISSTMHDLGKIAIPDSILLKPAKLTYDEFEIMKTHTTKGYEILKDSSLSLLKTSADIAYEHHEYYNGEGYPRGIKAEEISIYARIVAIADVFDALLSKRVYKDSWSIEDVISYFKEKKAQQFDPKLTELMLDNIDSFLKIHKKYQD